MKEVITVSMAICVFCSSQDQIHPKYFDVARELGAAIGQRGYTLVYGAGRIGLMGEVARAVQAHGGRVVGVIPEALNQNGIVYEEADELIVTRDLRERKSIMDRRSDAFVALPGGFGTMDEVFETLTLKQLRYHNRPLVFLDVDGFFEPVARLLDRIVDDGFALEHHRNLYQFVYDVPSVFEYLESYEPPEVWGKWA